MKALSIRPEYADEIAEGYKTEEYRSWRTSYRGDLLICASSYNNGVHFVRGHALCVVDLYNIEKADGYIWHLRNVRLIEPFPVKGKLYLFDVDDTKIIPFAGSHNEILGHWKELGLIR